MRIVFFLVVLLFLTAAAGETEQIRISADLHLSSGGTDQQEAFRTLCAEPADVLILLGDLANSGHLREHQMVTEGLAGMDAEIYVLPGNHDLSAEISPDRFPELYAAFGYDRAFARDPDSLSYAALTRSGICLLMLDTNEWNPERRMVLHGGIAPHLGQWTETTLARLPEGTPVFAFGHYPLSADGANDTAGGADHLMQVLRENGVRAYFCGHRHSNGTFETDGLRQILVGVPWSYPPLVRTLEQDEGGYRSGTEVLYPEGSARLTAMRRASAELAEHMAEGSLAGTAYEGNPEAVAFFKAFFDAAVNGRLGEVREVLLTREGYRMWQEAEVRTAVRPWLLSTLAGGQEDYHEIRLR